MNIYRNICVVFSNFVKKNNWRDKLSQKTFKKNRKSTILYHWLKSKEIKHL